MYESGGRARVFSAQSFNVDTGEIAVTYMEADGESSSEHSSDGVDRLSLGGRS